MATNKSSVPATQHSTPSSVLAHQRSSALSHPARQSANAPTYAFIDGQNLNLGTLKSFKKKVGNQQINYTGWKLDFRKFNQYLKTKYNVSKSFLFIGYIPQNKPLYQSLEKFGYKLIFKPTITQHGETKGNVDSDLVLHTMINLKKFSKAIIVAGDGDYLCLVEYLIKKNKLFKIVIPNRYSYSSLLRTYRKFIIYITDLRNNLEYKIKKRGSSVRTNP